MRRIKINEIEKIFKKKSSLNAIFLIIYKQKFINNFINDRI